MDQRIEKNDAPLHTAASMDPGFIPGITPAGADATAGDAARAKKQDEDAAESSAAGEDTAAEAAEAAASEEVSGQEAPEAAGQGSDAASEEDSSETAATEDGEGTEAEEADGAEDGAEPAAETAAESEDSAERPVFEARDHRGAITVDADGIGFTLDDQATDFTWDEVVAVEHSTPRFAKRLTVTVHTKGERWYPNEVRAPDRATLTRWAGELDDALDAYFEE